MTETHPFGDFVPRNARYLILGSFTGRQAVKGTPYFDKSYDWFYGTRGNQFWPMLEEVYEVKLPNKPSKQELFTRLGMAIADIIYECERRDGSNLDTNLEVIQYNKKGVTKILESNHIENVYFTSRFVEKRFKKAFKDVIKKYPQMELIYLPSPSRRYARMTREEKVRRYKKLLPKL